MNYYTYGGNLRDRNKFTSTANTTFGTKRYFSSLDSEVYFGDKQIDEIFHIDFVISEPKLPIYGFNSFYANRIVTGRRTIQGTFAINFTHTNAMINLLNSIEDSILKNKYESVVARCEGDDSTGLGIGNSGLFTKQFDITISYGYGKNDAMRTLNGCYQTLVGVQIVDYRQALDTEGNPILDMYSFIAKDIRYESIKEGSIDDQDDTKKAPAVDSEQAKYIIANSCISEEYNKLITSCENDQELDGFILTPYFNYIGESHFISLTIDSKNNNTEVFKNVIITVDNKKGTKKSYTINNVNKGVAAIFDMGGSSRDFAVELYKYYSASSNYSPTITIEFVANVNDAEEPIKHSTKMFLNTEQK
jgi:hypothetical protein